MEAVESSLERFSFMGPTEWQIWQELKDFDLCTALHSAKTLFYFAGMINDQLKILGRRFTLAQEIEAADINVDDLYRAAFLHDCGKLRLTKAGKELILSSKKLSSEDRSITEEHEFLSHRFLSGKGLIIEAQVAGQHHNYSGSDLLVNFKVRPLGLTVGVADLLHLTDVQEALLAQRPYRKPLPPLKTLVIVIDEVMAGRVNLKTALMWIFIQLEKLKKSYLTYNLASSSWSELENLVKIKDFLKENSNLINIEQLSLA